MSRRLSNIEWATFLNQVDVDALNLPPWGGIVHWGGMDVLVYQGPIEVFLTDVSDLSGEWKAEVTSEEYDPKQGLWYYQLPQVAMDVIAEKAIGFSESVTSALSTTLSATPLILGGAALLGVFMLRRI